MGPTQKHNGFSLVGLLAGVGVLSVVVIGSGYLLSTAKQTEIRSDLQSELDRSHLLAVQQTRSIAYLKKHLALFPNPSQNAGNAPQNTSLLNCLARQGTQCQQYGTNTDSQFRELTSASTTTPCAAGHCAVYSSLSYRGICTATSCSSIDVRFSSQYTGDQYAMKPRVNLIRLASSLLAGKGNVAFTCTSQRALASIDTENLEAVCQPASPTSCPANAPVQGVGACVTPVAQNCAIGVKTIGLNSGSCRGAPGP